MRAYRNAWLTVVASLTIAALLAAGASIGWPVLIVAVGAITVGGAACGYAWVEEPEQRGGIIGRMALGYAVGALLVLGLPVFLGPWAPLVVAAILVSSPLVVDWLLRRGWRQRPEGAVEQVRTMRARELELRWLRTGARLRHPGADPATALALVQERALILDELERRDPGGFDAILRRSGWREPQDH